jgi:hypothetical protein
MLSSISPRADVLSTISPLHFTFTLFHVVNVISFINAAIWPFESSSTIHSVAYPGTSKLTTINPSVFTLSLDVVPHKLTFVDRAIEHFEITITMF